MSTRTILKIDAGDIEIFSIKVEYKDLLDRLQSVLDDTDIVYSYKGKLGLKLLTTNCEEVKI